MNNYLVNDNNYNIVIYNAQKLLQGMANKIRFTFGPSYHVDPKILEMLCVFRVQIQSFQTHVIFKSNNFKHVSFLVPRLTTNH